MTLQVDDIEALIAFIKSHEREDIPDDVWDLCVKMCDVEEESPCNNCQEWDCYGCKYKKDGDSDGK